MEKIAFLFPVPVGGRNSPADYDTTLVKQESYDPNNEESANDTSEDQGEDEDDDEDDFKRFTIGPERVPKVSEKKRLDAAAFAAWVQNHQGQISSTAKETFFKNEFSSPSFRNPHSTTKIITKPREYQNELFERAKEKNIIVVLDTGSGKTLIGIMLIRHIVDQELENRAIGKPKKTAFFLVDKGPLCSQQYAALRQNLEYPMAKFHGALGGAGKNKAFWDEQFAKQLVIVCTAQILLDCLNNGYIQIKQINLLIFDEAHHTKKNHPYAGIIRQHYLRERSVEDRPRILGMTASPVDAQTNDVTYVAMELESLLCSKIATVSDQVLEENLKRREQVESVERYRRVVHPEGARTDLWKSVAALVSGNPQFYQGLDFAQDAASQLGSWCADRFWKLQVTEGEIPRLQARTRQDLKALLTTAQVEAAVDNVKKVEQIVNNFRLAPPSLNVPSVSSKVLSLWETLNHEFARGTERCIVFVEKRSTALLLADLFAQREIAIPGLIPAYLIGSHSGALNFGNMSVRDQAIALIEFRNGDTNCLFATPIAEEGIDIPACDLIVRFDMYQSVIQYIQSKGRARQQRSRHISMVEEGNLDHQRRLRQALRDAQILRRFCLNLPEDRKVEDVSINAAAAAEYELLGQKSFEVPTTGARLTFGNSTEVLARFVASLPNPTNEASTADYIVTTFDKKFAADVILPDASPIKLISGFKQQSKILARCSAAFEACIALINKGYIDEHFQSTLRKKIHAMRNARLAISPKQQSEYVMRLKPEIWSQLEPEVPRQLFKTVVFLCDPDSLERQSQPLLLLTRSALPGIPDIPIFPVSGGPKLARLLPSSTPFLFAQDEVEALASFTLRVFTDVFSKEFDAGSCDLPYFFAPSLVPQDNDTPSSLLELDWALIKDVQAKESFDWEGQPEGFFHDKFVVDPADGSRKFIIHGINKDLKPSDPAPLGVPEPKTRGYRESDRSIKQYSNSLWTKSRKRAAWRDDQPVVNAELLPLRRNLLDEFGADEGSRQYRRCYLILEPLRVSKVPVEFVSMAMTMPAILHRLESVLIVLEACSLLELDISPGLALEAMTKDSENSDEHGEEQINFQAGMGCNYERLEFLGDSFLKMATTISLFTLVPDFDESQYHDERMLMVCNQNLFHHALGCKLYEYIRSKSFDRRTWYPNLKLRKGKAPKSSVNHNLADKSIADVCEALIGAAYLTGMAQGSMDMAVAAVSRMVKNKNHAMMAWKEYYEAFKVPEWHLEPATAAQKLSIDQVEEITGYRFQCGPLLRSAFKHPSYTYESIPHYQRLEFLGDSLLDMVTVDYLFKEFPQADPQWLTEHKMAMVSNQFLGCLCVKLGLYRHLLRTTSGLNGQIAQYISDLRRAEEAARDGAIGAGEPARKNFWVDAPQPPKALSDMVESLVGAIFVDAKYDYRVVQKFFDSFIQPYFDNMAMYDAFASKHPVKLLSMMIDKVGCNRWRLCATAVPCSEEEGLAAVTDNDVVCALMVHEKVIVHAVAKSGRYAKIRVAKQALAKLEGWTREDYVEHTGCDCSGVAMQPDAELEDHGTAI